MTSEALRIATDDPKYSEPRVPITVTCKQAMRVTAAVQRPAVMPGSSVLVQLRGRDGEVIRIDHVEPSNVMLAVRDTAGRGNFGAALHHSTARNGTAKLHLRK